MACPIAITKFVGTVSLGLLTVCDGFFIFYLQTPNLSLGGRSAPKHLYPTLKLRYWNLHSLICNLCYRAFPIR